MKLWIITGDEISSGRELTIFYAGHEVDKNYLITLAFGSSYRENYIGKKWLWQIPQIVKEDEHGCSLMITEVPKCLSILSDRMKCFYIPSWVYGEVDLSVNSLSVFKSKNSSLKSDLSKIRQSKLHYEVTNDLSQLHNFYYNMYLPYLNKVHGNRSEILSYDYVKRQFGRRGLFNDLCIIKKEEECIAGSLLSHKKNRAKLCLLGIKDGNLDYIKDGAIGALFYFPVCYLAVKGCARIDFGASRPFLKDGVLRYKKKWNPKISNQRKIGFLFKMLSKTNGVKGFFLNNPFIYKDKAGFHGAIFMASDQPLSKEAVAKIYKDYYMPGLSKLVIYQFDRNNGEMKDIVLPKYSDKIIVRSAEDIFCTS